MKLHKLIHLWEIFHIDLIFAYYLHGISIIIIIILVFKQTTPVTI